MTEKLRMFYSDEKVASYLRWIINSDISKKYWEHCRIKADKKDIKNV